MSDYENILISAVRYALGRSTYVVNLTVNYIIKEMVDNKISNKCLCVMLSDIQNTKNLGMDCDTRDWLRLMSKIQEVLNNDS